MLIGKHKMSPILSPKKSVEGDVDKRVDILCAGIALMVYELSVFAGGLFLELTHFGRLGVFLLTGLLSWMLLLPLYPLIDRIGRIGGTEWKE
jgi:CDP-diglyceride synthetase